MRISRIFPYYVGICIVSLFTGFAYETKTFVLRPFDVLVGLGVFLLAANASLRGYARRVDKGFPYYLFAALYLYRGLSGLVMTSPVLGMKELLQGLEFLFLIHLVVKATRRQENRRRFLQTLYVGLGCVAVVTALLHVAEGQYSGYKYLPGGEQKYAFGLFALMALVFWLGEQKNAYTLPILVVAILLALLSGERKGWVALAAAAGAIYYAESNFNLWRMLRAVRPRYLAVVGLAVVGGFVATNFEYVGRQMENLESTYEMVTGSGFDYVFVRPGQRQDVGRYNGLVFITAALSRRPIFGVGTERGKEAIDEIPNPGVAIKTGHGQYQRFALENGLTGLLLYMFIWISIVTVVFIKKFRHSVDYLSLLFVSGFVFYSIVVNAFMGGGSLNIMFVSVSIGVVISVYNTK